MDEIFPYSAAAKRFFRSGKRKLFDGFTVARCLQTICQSVGFLESVSGQRDGRPKSAGTEQYHGRIAGDSLPSGSRIAQHIPKNKLPEMIYGTDQGEGGGVAGSRAPEQLGFRFPILFWRTPLLKGSYSSTGLENQRFSLISAKNPAHCRRELEFTAISRVFAAVNCLHSLITDPSVSHRLQIRKFSRFL